MEDIADAAVVAGSVNNAVAPMGIAVVALANRRLHSYEENADSRATEVVRHRPAP